MNVRDLSIELRPRSDWEAVDLGAALTKRYYRDLLRIGLVGFGPLFVVLAAASVNWPWLLVVLIWWLKPLMDRFYLFYLSRRIFGQEVTVKETLAQWRRLLFKGTFSLLTWRRFSFYRSLSLPVSDLENLSGKARSQRCSVVGRIGGGFAILTSVGGVFLELMGMASLLIFFFFLIPQGQSLPAETIWFWFEEGRLAARLLLIGYFLSYGFLVLLLEPFYLASGFALYLNSRTSQEAWDVELRFRELAARLEKTRVKTGEGQERSKASGGGVSVKAGTGGAALMLALAFSLTGGSPLASAQEQDPQVVVQKVLSDPDFTIHTETYRDYADQDLSWLDRLFDWMNSSGGEAGAAAGAIESLLQLVGILALILLVVFIAILIVKSLEGRKPRLAPAQKTQVKRPPPSVVMGMDVTPESLPADLLSSARSHWQQGQARLALSLLYRGALVKLITEEEVAIVDSDTEYECLAEVERGAPQRLSAYFRQLSQQWMKAAYSPDAVAPQDFETLCSAWPFKQR